MKKEMEAFPFLHQILHTRRVDSPVLNDVDSESFLGVRGGGGVRSPKFVSSPELKALGELIGWDSSRRPSVRSCVCPSTLSNMNISETSWPITN